MAQRPLPDALPEPEPEARLEVVPDPVEAEVEADEGRTIRLPVHVAEQVRKVMRARRVLAQKLNREALLPEIAKESGFPPERVRTLLELIEDPVSLETPVGDGESLYGDLIEDTNSARPDAATALT